jgi:hypothetical protein
MLPRLLPRTLSTLARYYSTAPLSIPNPAPPPSAEPIRVPYLPDNDFSRYHAYEHSTVEPPHKPIISAIAGEGVVASNSALGDVLDSPGAGVYPDGTAGANESANDVDGTGPGMLGAAHTKAKGTIGKMEGTNGLKVFAVGAAVWWVIGEGVMRSIGIL